MPKKETNSQSSNQEELLNKKETEEEHKQIEKRPPLDTNRIREIAQIIADSSYDGCYTLERYTKSLYRFGFGIDEAGNVPIMFEGKTANEAMYRAIDFELTLEIELLSHEKLTKLAADRLTIIHDEQQKCKRMEEKLAAKNSEYKELVKERDELKQERKAISKIIDRVIDSWKDDEVMQSFEKDLASWKKRPSVFIAFILENIEKLMHEATPYVAPPIEEPERREKERLFRGGALAVVDEIRILESIWNDMQDSIMDGEWHTFSEADEIIRAHGDRELALVSIQQKRRIYIRFARDKKYHLARGEKDYLYERKGMHKFRFTLVKPPELEKDKVAKSEKLVEKREYDLLEAGPRICIIMKHSIFKNPYDEFERLFCDGKWHFYSKVGEIFKKYRIYYQYTREGIRAVRNCYVAQAKKFYPINKDGILRFKFGKKFDKTEMAKIKEGKPIKSPNNVKCARCGQAIWYDEECHQVDDLFYHLDCYKVIAS